jgi:hypothetical protein
MNDPVVGVLNPAARREDFKRMPNHMQQKIAALLETCAEQSLSVRCDNVGGDVYVIVGRGLSAPRHWQEMFGLLQR